jgi:hypothetical protein
MGMLNNEAIMAAVPAGIGGLINMTAKSAKGIVLGQGLSP